MAVRDGALQRYGWLSIAAALATISLKTVAYAATGSVGLLSDAFESTVNLVAAVLALLALRLAARPPDHNHHFGHGKVEYLSAGAEGAMILAAAGAITVTAVPRLVSPQELESVGLGLAISGAASLVNLAVGLALRRAGRRHHSLVLVADGQHLLADVWTTGGVFVGVTAAQLTGWTRLDPIVALLVAANIVVTGARLVRRSTAGLMDEALPAAEHDAIASVLDEYRARGVEFHALRTGEAGSWPFVSVHVLVPGAWSVQRGHDLVEEIEASLGRAVPGALVFTHLEPVEDPASFADIELGPR